MSNIKMTQEEMATHFARAAEGYEQQGGNITKAISRHLFTLTPPSHPLTSHSIIHDNGCGPGITTGELIDLFTSKNESVPKIHATDVSTHMIQVMDRKGWTKKYGVETQVMDGMALKFPDATFTHTFCNFMIFAMPDPVKGVSEMHRTLKPGGIAFVTTWKTVGWLPPYQRAQKRVRPDAPLFEGPVDPKSMTSEKLKEWMAEGGFKDIDLTETTVSSSFRDVGMRDMATAITGMICKGWSDEDRAKYQKAAEEEVQKEEESGEKYSMVAWCAVAPKSA